MYKRILIASDGSGPSMHAARAAALLAKALSAEITVLTVARLPEQYKDDLSSDLREGYIQEWQQALDAAVGEIKRQGLEPKTRFIRDEEPAPAILKELEGGGYDLLVIGRTGTGNPASKTMGRISDKVTSEATCSLLVVR